MVNHQSPLVSIIIPVYNSELYVEDCLQSAINQTYANLEIIIVNDGSTDGSASIIAKYADLDKRIVLINKQNEGLPLARRTGIDVAKGKYIQYLDSDDTLMEYAIECLVERAESTDADIVAAAFYFCDMGKPKKLSVALAFDELLGIAYLKEMLNLRAYWSVWSNFQRRSLFEDNKIEVVPHIYFGEDAILITQLLLNNPKVVSLNKPILNYNRISTSITHAMNDNKYKNFRGHIVWIENYITEKGFAKEFERELAFQHLRNTFTCIYWKHFEDANKDMKGLIRSLKMFPELKEFLSKRERKIVLAYRISSWLGYLNLVRYNKQGKI
ncbi:MAG: glycosyltransferase [Bacteroidaceae bacterium]